MRILIVHHGSVPHPDRPVTGGALRARQHATALHNAGHEAVLLARDQDSAGGFRDHADLRARVRDLRPDRIVCVQPEDAPALRGLDIPLAVDLYAPRLLEAAYDDTLATTTAAVFGALDAGDVFLVSNSRQQWSWYGVLALAGFDLRHDPTRCVPLAAPQGVLRREPPDPLVLVGGGTAWPWQQARPALERVLQHLDRRQTGTVVWTGGAPLLGTTRAGWTLPTHPRLVAQPWKPYDDLLAAWAGASAAIDWMGTHPERSLALSFRHVDALGAGLPILTSDNSALADVLGDAGIATEDIEAAIDRVLDDPAHLHQMRDAAYHLAQTHFHPDTCTAPLVDWVSAPSRAPRRSGPLAEHAALLTRALQAEHLAARFDAERGRLEAEVVAKRQEVEGLHQDLRTLLDSVARQARALDEVAGFKREAIQVLGNREEMAQRNATDLARENALLTADNEKKSAELRAMDSLRERLENDLHHLRAELERTRSSGLFRRTR